MAKVSRRLRDLAHRSLKVERRKTVRFELRRCLRCEGWFQSEGPQHRRCDKCVVWMQTYWTDGMGI